MDLGDWVSLLICAGGLGGLAYLVWMTLGDSPDRQSSRPVWIVLLAGGTDGTGRQDGPDDGDGDGGPDDGRPPRVPYRAPGFGISSCGRGRSAGPRQKGSLPGVLRRRHRRQGVHQSDLRYGYRELACGRAAGGANHSKRRGSAVSPPCMRSWPRPWPWPWPYP